jgi:hypothetical protein
MLQRRGRVDRPAADRVGLLVRTHESGAHEWQGTANRRVGFVNAMIHRHSGRIGVPRGMSAYSVIMRSAHSTMETKTAGLPNFAPH